MTAISTIIFVHGAWADASAWNRVLPLLDQAGLEMMSVSLGLASLADDTAIVARAITLATAPVLLVGHSYGGAVMTQTGLDPKVTGLVYVAAFAPDSGDTVIGLGAGGPPNGLPDVLVPDSQGFLKLSRRGVDEVFAQDLSLAERTIIFQTQGPTAAAALNAPADTSSWKSKPSWYVRTSEDRTIHPDLQTMMAERASSTRIDLASGHLPMLSHPDAVADFIRVALQ